MLLNLTMLGQVFHVRLVDNVYWSLVVELVFYGIMLLIFLAGLLEKIELFIIPWLVLEISAVIGFSLFHHGVPQSLQVMLLLKYAHLFFAGILCFRIRCDGQNRSRIALLVCCLATHFIVQGLEAGLMGLIFFCTFFALAKDRLRFLKISPLVFLGAISYSLYLIHQNIGYIIMRQLCGFARPVQLLATEFVVVILAVCITFFIERPSTKFIRKLYENHWCIRPGIRRAS